MRQWSSPRVLRLGTCLTLLIGIMVLSGTVSVKAGEPGETAYAFLNIGTDARAEGMGGAQAGVADGINGVFYNPAALAHVNPGEFTASYVNWMVDIQSGFLAAVWGIGATERMGLSIHYLDFGDFQGFNASGQEEPNFGASDFALAVHGGGHLRGGFQWGLAGRLISESIDDESSTAFAADGGLLYAFRDQRTRIGVAVRNLGAQSSNFGDAEKDDLPTTAVLGFSHHLRGMPLLLAADAFQPADGDASLAVGLEYLGLESVIFRTGYNTLVGQIDTHSDSDDFAGLTFGVGFILKRVAIDYAYGSFSELGNAHRFTLRSSL